MEKYSCEYIFIFQISQLLEYLIFIKFLYKFKCGDVVQVNGDESIPCDLLILYTKSDDRKCYVTTANLDGETNFKVKWI